MNLNISLKNIKLTKKQQQNIAAAVIITGAAIFGYVKYLYAPLTVKAREKQEVLEQKKKELREARRMVSQYAVFLQEQHEINAKIDFMNSRLPKNVSIADVIDQITKQATMSNIAIIEFAPRKEYNRGDYREYEVGANFSTNFRDLGEFLTRLGYIKKVISPSDLRISRISAGAGNISGPGVKNISVELTLNLYSYKE